MAPPGYRAAFDLHVAAQHDRLVVGRGPDCDVVADSRFVSLRHCRITWASPMGVQVVDLQSSNGTYHWRGGCWWRIPATNNGNGLGLFVGWGEYLRLGRFRGNVVLLRLWPPREQFVLGGS